MKKLNPKELYCFSRAADLQEKLSLPWSKCYEKAEQEWQQSTSLTTLPDYDDDTSDLEGYLE